MLHSKLYVLNHHRSLAPPICIQTGVGIVQLFQARFLDLAQIYLVLHSSFQEVTVCLSTVACKNHWRLW